MFGDEYTATNWDPDTGEPFEQDIGCSTICDSCKYEQNPQHGHLVRVSNNIHLCLDCITVALIFAEKKECNSIEHRSVVEFQSKYYVIDIYEHKTNSRYIPKKIREKILAIGKCLYCGSSERLEVDHIIPVSKNGSNDIRNLQPLCKTCNIKKGVSL